MTMMVIALALLLVGCSESGQTDRASAASAIPTTSEATIPTTVSGERSSALSSSTTSTVSGTTDDSSTIAGAVDPVPGVLAEMSVEEKIGQLLMPAIAGKDAFTVTETEKAENLANTGLATPAEITQTYHLGGFIVMPPNIESAEQLREYSDQLQKLSRSETGVGLFFSVDQEGGEVNRIDDQVTVFPSAQALSSSADVVLSASYVSAQQLQRQGINIVLAPVADVVPSGGGGFIGSRSYGDDPDTVASMVTASITGLQDAGVAAAVKHWPGHGATTDDSHSELPRIGTGRADWEGRDRIPFETAIEDDVAIVLVGHLVFPALDDSGVPATASPVLIDQMLRTEMGFDGVVMTDALNMGAISSYDPGQFAVDSVLAGTDILLMPPNLSEVQQALLEAHRSGVLTDERLDESVERVLRLKAKLRLMPPADD